MTRDEAKQAGLPRYSTGEPCGHGHVAERYTVSGVCVECHRASVSLAHYQRKENPMASMIDQIEELNARLKELEEQIGKPPKPEPEPLQHCYGRSRSYTVRPIRNGKNIGIIRSDLLNKIDGMELAKERAKTLGLPIRFVRWDSNPDNEPGDAVLLIEELRVNLDMAHGGSNQLVREWRFSNPIPNDLK